MSLKPFHLYYTIGSLYFQINPLVFFFFLYNKQKCFYLIGFVVSQLVYYISIIKLYIKKMGYTFLVYPIIALCVLLEVKEIIFSMVIVVCVNNCLHILSQRDIVGFYQLNQPFNIICICKSLYADIKVAYTFFSIHI